MDRRSFLAVAAAGTAAAAGCTAVPPAQPSGDDPLDGLSNRVSSLPPIPAGEYQSRLERVRSLLAQKGGRGLVAEAGSTLQYLTGIRWGRSERLFAVTVGPDGAPVIVCPAFERERCQQQNHLELEIRVWQEHEDPGGLLAGALRDCGLGSGAVLVEPSTRWWIFDGLRQALPTHEIRDGNAVSEGCRIVKSPLEIERIRLANELTREAFRVALGGVFEGITESELAGRVSTAFTRMGVQGGAMVLFGINTSLPHGSDVNRQLRVGDVVLMDGGCRVAGYQSDVTRLWIYGEPSGLKRQLWELALTAQRAAIDAVRPGMNCGEVDRIARQVVSDGGYGPDYVYFTHRTGHGLGLDGHEAPYLVRDNPLELRPGMVLAVEPGIYVPGQFGFRHEDNVVVTDAGVEALGERVDEEMMRLG